MSARRGRLRRWFAQGLVLLIGAVALAAASVGLVLGTATGRARLLALLVQQIDSHIPGHVELDELQRLDPFAIRFAGVRLYDPQAHEVLHLTELNAELAPFELLRGRLVLHSLALRRGWIDLGDLAAPGRGLRGAVVADSARAAPEPPPERAPPPYVRIDAIVLSDLDVRAPALPAPWSELGVVGLDARAELELDGAPELKLHSLSAELRRAERPLAHLVQLSAHVAHPGATSEFALELALGAARSTAALRLVLSPPSAAESSPLGAEIHVEGLRAEDLAQLLDDPSLAQAFAGPLGLDLSVSGSRARLAARATLETSAGALELRADIEERRRIELAATGRDLALHRLRAELPIEPVSFELDSKIDLSDPARLPIELGLRSARLGRLELPVLSARGAWDGQRFSDVQLELRRGESRLLAHGDVSAAGALDLSLRASVHPTELGAWAAAAGVRKPPRARFDADLRLARTPHGSLSIQGGLDVRALRLPDLSLDGARVDVDLDGPPLALAGRASVRLTGLLAGKLRVPRAELRLEGGPERYRVRLGGEVEKLRASLELAARREVDRFVVSGKASGRYAETPFELNLGRTTLALAGWIETDGIGLEATGQRVLLQGGYGRAQSELQITAPALDVRRLAELAGLGTGWAGQGRLALRVRGRPQAPSLDGTLVLRGLGKGDRFPIDLTLGANLDAERGRASLDAAWGGADGAWLDAALAVASEFEGGEGWARALPEATHHVVVELKHLDVAGLEPWLGRAVPVQAELALSATLEGRLRQPRLHARLRGELTQAFGVAPLTFVHDLDYADGALGAELTSSDAAGPWLSLHADVGLPPEVASDVTTIAAHARELADTSRWKLDLVAARRVLGSLWPAAPAAVAGLELDGRLGLEHVAGAEPSGSASLRVAETSARRSPAGCTESGAELAFEAELARQRLEGTLVATHQGTELLRATTRASVELASALRGGGARLGSMSAELRSTGLDLVRIPYLCQRVRGRLDARVSFLDVLGSAPALQADVRATHISLGAEPSLDLRLVARADHDDAEARVDIQGPRGRSQLTARLPIAWSAGRFAVAADAPLSARAVLVDLPIAPLLDPAGALSYATGWVNGTVVVGGTLNALEPSGELALGDAELTATALAQPLHGVQGKVAFSRRALTISHFEARDRDGLLELSGQVDRRGAEGLDVKLNVAARAFPLRQRGQVVATTSGHAKIDATLSPTHSNVSVRLVDADTWLEKVTARSGIDLRAHPDFVIATSPGAAGTGAHGAGTDAPEPSAAVPARESHVRIDASDHFWIKREDFAIQLTTHLDATIVGDETKITGRVDIYRGYLDLMGRIFNVDRSSHLEFIGTSTPDPVLDITATYDSKSTGTTVKVQISGRGSKPVLAFSIDEKAVSVAKVLEVLVGRHGGGDENSARNEVSSFVGGLTAGLLATSARRELGAAAPIIMIEPGDSTGDGRIRAGFELDALVPAALRQLITGVYVEGIVEREGSGNSRGQEASTQAGVLVELYFPHQLFSTGQWGPGTTWSLDGGWQL